MYVKQNQLKKYFNDTLLIHYNSIRINQIIGIMMIFDIVVIIVVKVLQCNLEISQFELLSSYFVYFTP